LPGRFRQQIGFAIAAAQQKHEGLFGQILHGILPGIPHNFIGLAAVSNDAVGRQTQPPRRREDTLAQVTKGIPVAVDRDPRLGGKPLGDDDVRSP